MTPSPAAPSFVDHLGDGLLRRWSTAADMQEIARCLGTVYRDSPDEPLSEYMKSWMEIMFSPGFPLMGPGDVALVEDTSTAERPIVACACLWRQRWSLGGIPFSVGRTEYVATYAEYRNRGLMRGLMEMIHARSTARGDLVQAITGIPYYYRQFGYEYVLDLEGNCHVPLTAIPAKAEGEEERYHLRPATVEDAPHLLALYNTRRQGSLVWSETNEEHWRYFVDAWEMPEAHSGDPRACGLHLRLYMVTDAAGTACGFLAVMPVQRWGALAIDNIELDAQVNWQEAMPGLLRALAELAAKTPARPVEGYTAPPPKELLFVLGRAHPCYSVLGEKVITRMRPPYAWYVRVADVPAFVRHIAPVLEARLAASPLVNYSGEHKINFYRGGLRLTFERGQLSAAEPWSAPLYGDDSSAGCPSLVFLKLLFGYRSFSELRANYPDLWANDETLLLIETLFPKQPSWVQEMCYT
jgi:hypothetical protein